MVAILHRLFLLRTPDWLTLVGGSSLRPRKDMEILKDVDRMIVHHSASHVWTNKADLWNWHVRQNGWEDIGYHYLIQADGEIVPCRPICYMGAHARGNNADSIGVCVAGDNLTEKDKWTVQQILSLQNLYRHWQFLKPNLQVMGHRDVGNTECPGLDVKNLLSVGSQ